MIWAIIGVIEIIGSLIMSIAGFHDYGFTTGLLWLINSLNGALMINLGANNAKLNSINEKMVKEKKIKELEEKISSLEKKIKNGSQYPIQENKENPKYEEIPFTPPSKDIFKGRY
ncbi:MAG: hypothetical protein NC087_04475 [Anaeroplasma bactoclasticum]|nr:hypothetical protein [Anaeroplasma bactoclasticum]